MKNQLKVFEKVTRETLVLHYGNNGEWWFMDEKGVSVEGYFSSYVMAHQWANSQGFSMSTPAQAEQQPVAIPEAIRAWMMDVPLPDNEYGYRLTNRRDELLAAPIAQTAPQPEQGRMARALRAFVSLAEDRLHELGTLSPEMFECLNNGRAALSTQEK